MERPKTEITLNGTFTASECLWFLNRGYDECLYRLFSGGVRRLFKSGSELLIVDIHLYDDKIILEWLNAVPSGKAVAEIAETISEWLDLETDLEVFYLAISADPRIAYMATEFSGLPLIGIPDLFEALCWAIIGQQINLSFAYKIKRRLVERFGESLVFRGEHYYLFPSPAELSTLTSLDFAHMQLSESKITYLIRVAESFRSGELSKAGLMKLNDTHSRISALVSIKGIGQWTANYALMKSLRERSCIPYRDAGLLNALLSHGIISDKTDQRSAEDFFAEFKGFEAHLVFYFWRSLSPKR